MTGSLILIAIGLVALAGGGELLVRGAVGIANKLGVGTLFTGLVIVGAATSMPEMVASVQAVMAVDTLLSGLVTQGQVSGGAATSLRTQINQAYAAVAEPNSYKPLEFRRALGGAVRTIRSLQ